MTNIQGGIYYALAIPGNKMEARFKVADDIIEGEFAFKDQRCTDMHGLLFSLTVKEEGIHGFQASL